MAKNFQVYKSSAGSGKTFTLAKFYLRLVLTNSNPKFFVRILAITFTVKAAAEMKQRILGYLKYFSKPEGSDSGSATMLNLLRSETGLSLNEIQKRSGSILHHLLQNYGDFSVLTIDKFIHKIVRSFSNELGFDPSFEIQIDTKQIVDEVVTELIEECGSNQDLTPLLIDFALTQSKEDRNWDISQALTKLGMELDSEDFYISHSGELMAPDKVSETQEWLTQFYTQVTNETQELGRLAQEIMDSYGLEAGDFYQGKRGVFGFFAKASDGQLKAILSPNNYVLATINEEKWQSTRGNDSVLEIANELKTIIDQLIEKQSTIRTALFYQKLKPSLYSISLIQTLLDRIDSAKRERNQRLLSDFYRALNQHLHEEQVPFVFERIGIKYQHILIDEFQDTSHLQWNALRPLVVNMLSEGKETLIVGDSKQSIYRFRGSDPQQLPSLPKDTINPEPLIELEFEEHVLQENYRSAKKVVEFNNAFFDALSQALVSSEFQNIYTDLYQNHTSSLVGSVMVHGIEAESGIDKKGLFFHAMRNRIDALGASLSGEVCVLFQKNDDAAAFTSMMLEEGYQITSNESLLVNSSPRVHLIIATLSALQKPRDPYSGHLLLAKLHQNKLVGSDMHRIATELKAQKLSVYQILKRVGITWNPKIDQENMYEFIVQLARMYGLPITDFYMRKLLDFAFEYHANMHYLKESFLEHWERVGINLSIDTSGQDSPLKVMTIHKSKGLEFENVLVFLPEVQAKKTTRSFLHVTGLEVPNLNQAIVPVSTLKDSPYKAIYAAEKDKTNLDLLNTIYVGFTRARSNLDVFTSVKNGKIQSEAIRFLQDWPDWDADSSSLSFREGTS